MTRRPRRQLVVRALALATASGAAVVSAFAAPAAADIAGVPGGSAPAGTWIAFQLSNPSNLHSGETVTLSRVGASTATTQQLWGSAPGSTWPNDWSGPGFSLHHEGTACPAANSSCDFTVSGSGSAPQFLFASGVTQTDPPGIYDSYKQDVSFAPPPPPPTTQPPVSTTQPPPGPSSHFTGPSGALTPASQFTFASPNEPGVVYTWTLLNGQGSTVATCGPTPACPTFTPPSSVFNSPGQYTLTLHAENANTHAFTESSVPFEVAPQTPLPQSPPPAAQPQSSAGFHPAAAPSFTPVSFTPRLTDFATPKPGAVQPVTVIWLWRPDWFQATANKPKTAGRPRSVARAAVSVGSNRGGPSATPWLAGLATFGLFGAAWLAVRRRRVRTSILD